MTSGLVHPDSFPIVQLTRKPVGTNKVSFAKNSEVIGLPRPYRLRGRNQILRGEARDSPDDTSQHAYWDGSPGLVFIHPTSVALPDLLSAARVGWCRSRWDIFSDFTYRSYPFGRVRCHTNYRFDSVGYCGL